MRFTTSMPKALKPYFQEELRQSATALAEARWQHAWHHLERAHIIGQAYPWQHSLAHWQMLKFGFRIKSTKEITGQLLRLLVGGIKSFVGVIPVGNTGGANVPPLQPMELPRELKQLLQKYGQLK